MKKNIFAFAFLFRLLLAHQHRDFFIQYFYDWEKEEQEALKEKSISQDFDEAVLVGIYTRKYQSDVENGKFISHPSRPRQRCSKNFPFFHPLSLTVSHSDPLVQPVSDVCLNIFPSPVFFPLSCTCISDYVILFFFLFWLNK